MCHQQRWPVRRDAQEDIWKSGPRAQKRNLKMSYEIEDSHDSGSKEVGCLAIFESDDQVRVEILRLAVVHV